jgi:hypothetical protein
MLEAQIDEKLSGVEISPLFMEWAIKQINKMNEGEREFRESTIEGIRRAHDAIIIKLDNLLRLKISPDNSDGSLLSDERFKGENARLENELRGIECQLVNIDERMMQANNDAARGFNFVARAKERFALPDIKIKRDIFMGLGLHLTLRDKIVAFDSPEYIIKIAGMKKGAPIIAERVAPEKELAMRAQFEEKYAAIPNMLRG